MSVQTVPEWLALGYTLKKGGKLIPKAQRSRPLVSEEECDRYLSKDEDVRFYMNRDAEISYNNLREYQL